jgi:4-amino-4-deoxy-L-arabinose transferase-like glycosyltransferase
MSVQKAFQWTKDNGALAFLLATQMVAIIGVFAWLAVSSLQSQEQPAGKDPAVFAKHLPAAPTATDSQAISAQPAASEVK